MSASKTTRRRFAVAALSMVTIAAACSDSSPPDTDASVTNDASKTPDVHTADATPDVPGDTQQGVDASGDATSDATDDAADATDDAADATDDAADASDDVTAFDAPDDVDMGDAADASSDDASPDASDAATFDAGSKGCKGIFCMVGHTCCNNSASVNYGKCELTTCTTCCM